MQREPNLCFLCLGGGSGTDDVSQNWGYAVSGTTSSGSYNSPGFSFQGGNTFGENPNFPNPVRPGAPNCNASSSVPACMAAMIVNFKPTNTSALGLAICRQAAHRLTLFPQWMCTTSLPAGLITAGCHNARSTFGAQWYLYRILWHSRPFLTSRLPKSPPEIRQECERPFRS